MTAETADETSVERRCFQEGQACIQNTELPELCYRFETYKLFREIGKLFT